MPKPWEQSEGRTFDGDCALCWTPRVIDEPVMRRADGLAVIHTECAIAFARDMSPVIREHRQETARRRLEERAARGIDTRIINEDGSKTWYP